MPHAVPTPITLLVAIDGSAQALHALDHALALCAAGLAAELLLANVQEAASLYEVVVAHDPAVLADVKVQAGNHLLDAAQARCRFAHVPSLCEVRQGDAAAQLVELAADHGCAAIVMGARGMDGPGLALLGSVAQAVLHHAGVPVTIVREVAPDVEPTDLAQLDDARP